METNSHLTGLLGAGSKFNGEIRFEGTFRVDGVMTGRIVCKNNKPSTVIISQNAIVDADIVADIVVVSGQLVGKIQAMERIEVYAPGKVEGQVYTSEIMIAEKALFQGQCVMIRHLSLEEKNKLKQQALQLEKTGKVKLPSPRQSVIQIRPAEMKTTRE